MRLFQRGNVRRLSQHLVIHSRDASSPISFNVNLLKVPSNFGYSSSRINRMYNEDRWQTSILDMDVGQLVTDTSYSELMKNVDRVEEPKYGPCPKVENCVFAFGVFDGHGGDECSDYLKNHLFENVERLAITRESVDLMREFYKLKISGYWKRWNRRFGQVVIQECGLRNVEKWCKEYGVKFNDFVSGSKFWDVLDKMIASGNLTHWEIFRLRVWVSYLFTDLQFLTYENEFNSIQDKKGKVINSGSTCTSAFIYGIDWQDGDLNHYFYDEKVVSRLVVAHVGDTRAILCDKDGVARTLTKDHHPSNPIEAQRLRKLSAGLIMTDSFGEERYLNFANTRSFGDISAKNVGITAEPEISEWLIGDPSMVQSYKKRESLEIPDFGGDECFLVLTSDGVTNTLSDQEIVDIIMTNYNNKGHKWGNPSKCANEVVEFVQCIDGDDNATCLVVRLAGWGKWPILDRTGKLREERMMGSRYRL
ncbi:unnamed protein product [Pichia kudriavzevii]